MFTLQFIIVINSLICLSFRIPLSVRHIRKLGNDGYYPVCPKCNKTMEREFQAHCDRCGQKLKWDRFT